MSRSVTEEPYEIRQTYYLRQKTSRTIERLAFLQRCKAEQVLPPSAPVQLKSTEHPFSPAARAYLDESIRNLQDRAAVLSNRCKHAAQIPSYLESRLKAESNRHEETLNKKLKTLCERSDWNSVGNSELITNLSTRVLTKSETAVLSLGLKFDIGGPNKNIQEFVMKNNRYTDSDIEKGFKQGVSACITALAGEENYSIPERFAKAIDELRNDSSTIITTADKGGGVVIMNYEDYVEKMKTLLLDPNTYRSEKTGTCKIRSDKFNKQARKLLRQSEQGKKMQYLLEEKPTSPKMRGQPKTHKQGIPMRPITSGIGSAPHRLAKHLAKPLT